MNTVAYTQEILRLKKEHDAAILAHYYVPDEVQAVADYVGDSYYLSRLATQIPQKTLCIAGVRFMGESAKILNPAKTVLLPDATADCPMAHMVTPETIAKVRREHPKAAVVCYINSTAAIKEHADVCVTSANALQIVRALPHPTIFFIPDEHLGRHIAAKLPEKHFIFNEGFCPVHTEITEPDVLQAKLVHPDAPLLAHPECTAAVLRHADYIGSTSGIIQYATAHAETAFLIATESGVLYELQQKNPNKQFYTIKPQQICPDMKKITLKKIVSCLRTLSPAVTLTEEQRLRAQAPLSKMLELAK